MKAAFQCLVAALCLGVSLCVHAATGPSVVLQLADYIGVDYAGAVSNGEVVSASEYAEMQEFAQRIDAAITALPESDSKAQLQTLTGQLSAQVNAKAAQAQVTDTTRAIRTLVMRSYPVVLVPRVPPDLGRAAELFQQTCAACHGATGDGNGPAATALDPAPTNFHDVQRERQRSLYGLYNTITLGVSGTSMASFSHLSDPDRWALAFYVGGMFADQATLEAGARAFATQDKLSLQDVVTLAPSEMADTQASVAIWLRQHPQQLFADRASPIQVAITGIAQSAAAYAEGNVKQAETLAVSAYLDGFELAEAGLRNLDANLVVKIEQAMIGYRSALGAGAAASVIQSQADTITALLDSAQRALDETSLSAPVAFVSALIILLREGLEAILVLAAVTAFLVRTGRRDALVYLHAGWTGALALGGLTWVAATWLINISGAVREVTEGITALIAAGILFYVGFWMHNKMHADHWNDFLKTRVQGALDLRSSWGIAFIAFIAVYREVFETILFYEALWAQVDAGAHSAVFFGALAAAIGLVVITWGIFRFGLRLPLKQFFAVSSAVMLTLAVIFAGKGVAALQEAGKLPISPVRFLRIDLLGIYPTVQTLAAQLALILIGALLIWHGRRSERPAAP